MPNFTQAYRYSGMINAQSNKTKEISIEKTRKKLAIDLALANKRHLAQSMQLRSGEVIAYTERAKPEDTMSIALANISR